jgi:hypothetical protein
LAPSEGDAHLFELPPGYWAVFTAVIVIQAADRIAEHANPSTTSQA